MAPVLAVGKRFVMDLRLSCNNLSGRLYSKRRKFIKYMAGFVKLRYRYGACFGGRQTVCYGFTIVLQQP